MVSCDAIANVMCSLRIPNCPRGFEWVQNFDNSSCFSAPQEQVALIEQIDSTVKMTYSFWTYEHECSKFGARLAVLNSDKEQQNLQQWLRPKLNYGNYYFALGMKIMGSGSGTYATMVHNNM